MMNLQELQTISTLSIPIKILIINNAGYVSISQTHHNFFKGREIGASPKSGVEFPKFEKIAEAFDIAYTSIDASSDLASALDVVLNSAGPHICEVFVDPAQTFSPKLASRQLPDGTMVSPSLEDMAPFLPQDELMDNMISDR
jgi:acetolactate synthase-1/2/3 large subunit